MIQKALGACMPLAGDPRQIGPHGHVSYQATPLPPLQAHQAPAMGAAMLTVKKEEEAEEAEEAEAEEWTTKQEHAGGHDFVLKEPGLLALDNFETEFSSTLHDVMACELYFDPKRVGSNELCRIHHAMARTSRPMACLTVRQRCLAIRCRLFSAACELARAPACSLSELHCCIRHDSLERSVVVNSCAGQLLCGQLLYKPQLRSNGVKLLRRDEFQDSRRLSASPGLSAALPFALLPTLTPANAHCGYTHICACSACMLLVRFFHGTRRRARSKGKISTGKCSITSS